MAYTKQQLANLVIEFAGNYGIDQAIALEQIKRESANFRSDVVYGPFMAGAGERGLAQFTPATWADWGQGPHTNAYTPETSLTAWGRYMTWLLRRYGGNYTQALQGYNGGPGNVDRGTVSSAAQRYAREILAAAGSSGSGEDLP
ncbi:MAG: lytic transglycosylase domain-containing protein, partial [Acidobacteriales bacterium]|nr:lytic transglycosylase domain-containing protein [Terriglobales bacterium]